MDTQALNDCGNTTGKQDSLIRAMRFKTTLGDVQHQFDMEGYVCPNINCPCKEVTFYFYQANGLFDRPLFRISLNYETWRLNSTEIFDGKDDYPKIIHEFMSALDDEWKSLIMSERDNALTHLADSLREDIDYSSLDINSLIYYFEIYHSMPEQLVFVYDNTEYLVQDYYCANPECNCMDVLLVFTVVKNHKALGGTVLEIRLDLKAKTHRIEKIDRNIAREHAALLYNKCLDTLGRKGMDVLAERYFRMKKWGRECLLPYLNEAMTSNATVKLKKPKIGRNDLCPCGSGKKYKKCCGA